MSERSPPDSSDSLRTFLPDGLASTSMPVSSRLSGSVEPKTALAAGEQRLEQRLEVQRHVGERGREHVDDLLVDGLDDLRQLAPRGLHVVELRFEELVALLQRFELLERERVDRSHDPQLALELADTSVRRDALGQRRALGGHGAFGLCIEVASQGLDGGLDPQLGLGVVDLGAPGVLAHLVERPLVARPLLAQAIETRRDLAGRLGLPATALAQLGQLGLDHRGARLDESGEPLDGELHPLELDAAALGGLALGHVARQALLDLGGPSPKELPAFVERGGAHLDVGAQRADLGSALLEPAARRGHRTTSLERARLFRPRARAAPPRARPAERVRCRCALRAPTGAQ